MQQEISNTQIHYSESSSIKHTVQECINVLLKKSIHFACYGDRDQVWNYVSLDSRDCSEHTLFFGLAGNNVNGGYFISDVIGAKAACAIIDIESFVFFLQKELETNTRISVSNSSVQSIRQSIRDYKLHFEHRHSDSSIKDAGYSSVDNKELLSFIKESIPSHSTLIVIKDSLNFLMTFTSQYINAYRDRLCIIAISGSVGKTTTKNLLGHMLNHFDPTVTSFKNFNTVQGLALSILNANWKKVRYAVLEYGISTVGEMDMLVDMVAPDLALLTNVGTSHLGGYENKQELQREKLKIAKNTHYTKMLFLPEEDKELQCLAKQQGISFTLYGRQSFDGELIIYDKQLEGIYIQYNPYSHTNMIDSNNTNLTSKMQEIHMPSFIGASNTHNIYASLQVITYLKLPIKESITTLKKIKNVEQRFEIRCKEPLIIDDSYNANFESMQLALQWFARLPYAHTFAVLGGMKELGKESAYLHKKLCSLVTSLSLSYVVWIGEEYKDLGISLNHYYATVDEAQNFIVLTLQTLEAQSTAILLKGSHSYALTSFVETIIENTVLNRKAVHTSI